MIAELAILVAFMAPPLKLSTETLSGPDALAEPVRKVLEDRAQQISEANERVLTVWFRQSIPAKATSEQIKNGLTYREIPETAIVGVVKLHRAFIDYRKQEIPPGVYTLRLVFQPDTGDHTGTAPHTEFLLLCPASADKSPDETDVKTVVDMSKKATGGDHPGVLLLVPVKEAKSEPGLTELAGTTVLTIRRTLDTTQKDVTLGFGVVVKGVSKTR